MWWIKYLRWCKKWGRRNTSALPHLTWWYDAVGLIRPQRELADDLQQPDWLAATATRGCRAGFFLQEGLCCLWQLQLVQLLLREILARQTNSWKIRRHVRVRKLEEKAFCTEILLRDSSWHSCVSKANVENSWPTLTSSVWSIPSIYVQCQQKGNTLVLLLLEIKGSLNFPGVILKWVLRGTSK